METRKIIAFGSSSHVISIPKSWIKENNLKKGDKIFVQDNKDQLLLLPTDITQTAEPRKRVIEAEGKTMELIRAQIVSAYLHGYNSITIKGDNLQERAQEIKVVIRNLTGLEIIQQDAKRITSKDLLNLREISIPITIRRMDNIVRSMIIDSLDTEHVDYDSIIERDTDLNRLAYLCFRVMREAIKDPSLARYLTLSSIDILFHWDIVAHLEKIGDQAKRVARHMKKLQLTKKDKKRFDELYQIVYRDYLDVMKAFYKRDNAVAYTIDIENGDRIKQAREFIRELQTDSEVVRAVEHLKSMRSEMKAIAHAVLGLEEEVFM